MTHGRVEGIDKPVSRIVMGTMIAHVNNLPYSYAMLDHYFEIGGNTLDTGYVYGGGGSEKAVGAWVKSRGVRDQVVIIGKGAGSTDATPDMVTRQFLESLYRFGLESVDIYMMHRDNTSVPVGEFVDVLNEHVRAGRMKVFGGSNWTTPRLQAANEYAKAKGARGFTVSSPNFSLAEWNEPMWPGCVSASDARSRAWYEKTQMPLFAWSSQASGLFTGRFDPDNPRKVAAGANVLKIWGTSDIERAWFNEPNFERMRRVNQLAKRKNVSPAQIALAYVLGVPLNVFALIGPQTIEETNSSFDALDVKLATDELVDWLNLKNR